MRWLVIMMTIKVIPPAVAMRIKKRNLKLDHELNMALRKLIADTKKTDIKRAELLKDK